MAKRTRYHVTRRPDGRWQAKPEKASRASRVTKTKAEAVDKARELAKSQTPAQVIIHKSDGKIQTEYTYGEDPYPPQG